MEFSISTKHSDDDVAGLGFLLHLICTRPFPFTVVRNNFSSQSELTALQTSPARQMDTDHPVIPEEEHCMQEFSISAKLSYAASSESLSLAPTLIVL